MCFPSLSKQSKHTHNPPTHTLTQTDIKTAYKKDRNKRFVRLLYSSNSICILFSNFFDFSKICCFPATVQIKSRKMLPEQKTIIYTEFAHNCFFESPCLCSVVSCRKSVRHNKGKGVIICTLITIMNDLLVLFQDRTCSSMLVKLLLVNLKCLLSQNLSKAGLQGWSSFRWTQCTSGSLVVWPHSSQTYT